MNKNIVIVSIVVLVGVAFAGGYSMSRKANNVQQSNQTNNATPETKASSGKSLDLSGKQLTELPDSVTSQTEVTSLNLSNNQLTTLPANIGKMKNLQTLNVENNRLESLPAEIGQLSKLTNADFSNNRLASLPQELGQLSQLKTLNLGDYKGSSSDIDQLKSQLPNTDIKQ